eukprot:g73146.t1
MTLSLYFLRSHSCAKAKQNSAIWKCVTNYLHFLHSASFAKGRTLESVHSTLAFENYSSTYSCRLWPLFEKASGQPHQTQRFCGCFIFLTAGVKILKGVNSGSDTPPAIAGLSRPPYLTGHPAKPRPNTAQLEIIMPLWASNPESIPLPPFSRPMVQEVTRPTQPMRHSTYVPPLAPRPLRVINGQLVDYSSQAMYMDSHVPVSGSLPGLCTSVLTPPVNAHGPLRFFVSPPLQAHAMVMAPAAVRATHVSHPGHADHSKSRASHMSHAGHADHTKSHASHMSHSGHTGHTQGHPSHVSHAGHPDHTKSHASYPSHVNHMSHGGHADSSHPSHGSRSYTVHTSTHTTYSASAAYALQPGAINAASVSPALPLHSAKEPLHPAKEPLQNAAKEGAYPHNEHQLSARPVNTTVPPSPDEESISSDGEEPTKEAAEEDEETEEEEEDEEEEKDEEIVDGKEKKNFKKREVDSAAVSENGTKRIKVNDEKNYRDGPIRFNCTDCTATFTSKARFESHIGQHKEGKLRHTCEVCGRGYRKLSEIRCHMTEKSYKCTMCDAKFSDSSTLKRHIKIHTGEKPFTCDTCEAKFSESRSLKRHMRTHTNERPYKCVTCGSSFSHSSSLKTHMRTHTGEKPYECTTCDAKFSQSSSLKMHMRFHTGEKPFQCLTCGSKFSRSNHLHSHMRIHTGEKPFMCPLCDKCFSDNTHLKRHVRTHTGEKPFQCPYCVATFRESGTLKVHLRIHTGEKPFKCTFCDFSFSDGSALKRHIRIHTGEKPYKCTTCDACFSESRSRNRHMRIHMRNHLQNKLTPSMSTKGDGKVSPMPDQKENITASTVTTEGQQPISQPISQPIQPSLQPFPAFPSPVTPDGKPLSGTTATTVTTTTVTTVTQVTA